MGPGALRLCAHCRTNTKARPTWKCAAAPEGNSWIEISGSWEESFWGASCEVKQELLRKGGDLVCGRQHKIGIVFKWTTARLTLNGIKARSVPKSKKDFRGSALCLGAFRDADVYRHTDTDFLLPEQGFIPSLIQQWAELFPSSPVKSALPQEPLHSPGSALPALPSHWDLLPLPQPRVMLCLEAAGSDHCMG